MSPLRRPTPTELGQVGEAKVVEEAGEVHALWRVGDVRICRDVSEPHAGPHSHVMRVPCVN